MKGGERVGWPYLALAGDVTEWREVDPASAHIH